MKAEEILKLIRSRGGKGMALKNIIDSVTTPGEGRSGTRHLLRPVLRELVRSGQLVIGRGNRYFSAEATELVAGILRVYRGGTGVVQPTEGGASAIRIERSGMRGAVDGDRVLVRLEAPRKKARETGQREGVVVRVVERGRSTVVGRWDPSHGRPQVRPVDRRLGFTVKITGSEIQDDPAPGEFVEVSLDQVSTSGRAKGRLIERLGQSGDPGVDESVVLRVFGIDEVFPSDALSSADVLDGTITAAHLTQRWDLRDRPAVTVDPDTARDFDDAVSATRGDGDVIVVEVHIADVGHYVAGGSALDRAARDRSTSVYLPGRVVPMLPERLSSDLCSLRPNVERLAFTVRYEVHGNGKLGRRKARPSIIRSRCRATYGEAAEWLGLKAADWPTETNEFAESLQLCAEAADRLRRDRDRRGGLDFDLAEPRLVFDETGEVVDVTPAPRTVAHRMIEELMVAANRSVASILIDANIPALHRVHDQPEPRRLADLAATLAGLGVTPSYDAQSVNVRDLQKLLEEVAGKPSERLVSTLVLRSMARAVYSPEATGHFALAAEAYAHFTSPIRRYPDLVVHRALRRLLARQRPNDEQWAQQEEALRGLGEHCSEREQRAEKAERMAVEWRTMRFLANRVGDVFTGRISGVTDFGLFVQLDEFAVDGLLHVADLGDDYYEHDAVSHTMVGTRQARRWRLGDALEVRILRVDQEAMQLQLGLAGPVEKRRPQRRDSKKASSTSKKRTARGGERKKQQPRSKGARRRRR